MIKFKSSARNDYFISEAGVVYSQDRETLKLATIKPKDHKGYLTYKDRFIHRLVAIAFLPNPHNKPQVNHKDGNKKNNHVSNLEWATSYENNNHAFDSGLNKSKKLSDQDVLLIIQEYNTGQYSSRDLSARWGVCDRMIMSYVKGKDRAHLGQSFSGFIHKPGRKLKYSDETVGVIKGMLSNGFTRKEVSEKVGLSKGALKGILSGYLS